MHRAVICLSGHPVIELELIQSHMAQKPVLRGEVGCACVAREVSVEREGMGERGCARRLGGWVGVGVKPSPWPKGDAGAKRAQIFPPPPHWGGLELSSSNRADKSTRGGPRAAHLFSFP